VFQKNFRILRKHHRSLSERAVFPQWQNVRTNMKKIPYRQDLLELDIDIRLRQIWDVILENVEPSMYEQVAAIARAAYGQGYMDCLSETEEAAGSLCVDHGYKLPRHRRA
jgi:hypothetical protein